MRREPTPDRVSRARGLREVEALDRVAIAVVARHPVRVFLGDDLLAWLVLALGGALFAGNVRALISPPAQRQEGSLERAPLGRTLLMASLGLVGAIWALATLITQ